MCVYRTGESFHKKFAIWGCGEYLYNVLDKINPNLNIVGVCDSDSKKWGETVKYNEMEMKCVSPAELLQEKVDIVMVSIQSADAFANIKEKLSTYNIDVCHINDALKAYLTLWEEKEIKKYDRYMSGVEEPEDFDIIKCFISVTVSIDFCNLQCQYCYVGQHKDFYKKELVYYSPGFIRRALSRKRIGGTAFINFCGTGETLLCDELPEIIEALLEEGHYISIITNALITKKIQRILSSKHHERVFFKCSFHYLELRRKHLLEVYVNNVKSIKESGASLSIEFVPHDELIPYMDEMIAFSKLNFGALPHVTVARDETKADFSILSSLSETEYMKTWGIFQSPLFEVKMRTRQKQTKYCIAGHGTFLMNLNHGGTRFCPGNGKFINMYSHIDSKIEFAEIGKNCESPYCINGHAYLTFGMVPEVKEYSYLDVRDRLCSDGTHWVNGKMREIMAQRICDNLEVES